MGLPSFLPLAFAAARAALVRSLMRRASSSATAAKMCSVSREAKGWPQATKSTPASIVAMKATLRASRSSLATSRVALPLRAAPSAFAVHGQAFVCPRCEGRILHAVAFLFDIANPHRQIAGGTGETVDGGRAFASFAAAVDIACFYQPALISRRRVSGSQNSGLRTLSGQLARPQVPSPPPHEPTHNPASR